jgi:putative ATP-dependent endonuclease of OLD family
MGIPYAVVSDGDFYYLNTDGSKKYHSLRIDADDHMARYLGVENVKNIFLSIGIVIPKDISDERFRIFAAENGFFIGEYTFEVDIMKTSALNPESLTSITDAYCSLEPISTEKRIKFSEELSTGKYYTCLKRIEVKGLGKGRFAQRFSDVCTKENIPLYIQKSIKYITEAVNNR